MEVLSKLIQIFIAVNILVRFSVSQGRSPRKSFVVLAEMMRF